MTEQQKIDVEDVPELTEKEVTWDSIGGTYVKFETGKRKELVIKNARLLEKEAKKYESEETETRIFFEAQVVKEDGNEVDKTLSTSSKPFLRAAKEALINQDLKKELLISVKKFGDGNNTAYDIELR